MTFFLNISVYISMNLSANTSVILSTNISTNISANTSVIISIIFFALTSLTFLLTLHDTIVTIGTIRVSIPIIFPLTFLLLSLLIFPLNFPSTFPWSPLLIFPLTFQGTRMNTSRLYRFRSRGVSGCSGSWCCPWRYCSWSPFRIADDTAAGRSSSCWPSLTPSYGSWGCPTSWSGWSLLSVSKSRFHGQLGSLDFLYAVIQIFTFE